MIMMIQGRGPPIMLPCHVGGFYQFRSGVIFHFDGVMEDSPLIAQQSVDRFRSL